MIQICFDKINQTMIVLGMPGLGKEKVGQKLSKGDQRIIFGNCALKLKEGPFYTKMMH